MNPKYKMIPLLMAVVLLLSVFAAYGFGARHTEAKTVYVTECETVPEIITQTRFETVTVTEYEYIIPDQVYPNMAALDALLSEYTPTVSFGSMDYQTACEDYALNLERYAAEQGYEVRFYVMAPADYQIVFGKVIAEPHAVCLAIVGNEYIVIEPQTKEYHSLFGITLD